MTDLCKIENGIITNRAHFAGEIPEGWIPEGETWVANDEAQIGWGYDGSAFIPPPPKPEEDTGEPVPTIEDRLAALEEKASRVDALEAILVEKGTITAGQVEIAK